MYGLLALATSSGAGGRSMVGRRFTVGTEPEPTASMGERPKNLLRRHTEQSRAMEKSASRRSPKSSFYLHDYSESVLGDRERNWGDGEWSAPLSPSTPSREKKPSRAQKQNLVFLSRPCAGSGVKKQNASFHDKCAPTEKSFVGNAFDSRARPSLRKTTTLFSLLFLFHLPD